MTRDERIDRMKSARRTFAGWTPPAKEKQVADRHGIGGNSPPDYDPEAPVTGFPMVLRPMQPVSLDGKQELTCRGQVRAFEREHGVERIGLDYSGTSDQGEKPWWWDEYKENRREREKRAAQDKAGPEPFLPSKAPHKPKRVRNADL